MWKKIETKRLYAIILIILTLVSSIPMDLVYGATIHGTTSKSVNGDSLINQFGGGIQGATGGLVPALRIFVSRDPALYYNGTPQSKTMLQNTFAHSMPRDAGFGNSLIILPPGQKGTNIVLAEYVASSASLNLHRHQNGTTHPQISSSATAVSTNIPKQAIQRDGFSTEDGKGGRLHELSNGGWRKYSEALPFVTAQGIWGHIMRVQGGKIDIDKTMEEMISPHLAGGNVDITTLEPGKRDDIRAGYLGILISLHKISSVRGANGFEAKIGQAIEDYCVSGNLETAPVALVMDTVTVISTRKGKGGPIEDYIAIPSIDYLQYAGIVLENDRIDVTPERRVTKTGSPTNTRQQLVNAIQKRMTFSDAPYIPKQRPQTVRFFDAQGSQGSYESGLLDKSFGWGLAVPGWAGDRYKTNAPAPGRLLPNGYTSTNTGYIGMVNFYNNIEGFMITSFSVGEEPSDITVEMDTNLIPLTKDHCEPTARAENPPILTIKANVNAPKNSLALTKIHKDTNYTVAIEGTVERKKDTVRGGDPIMSESYDYKEMPLMSAQLTGVLPKSKAIRFLQGENLEILDVSVLEEIIEKVTDATTIVRYSYRIADLKITMGNIQTSYDVLEIHQNKQGIINNYVEMSTGMYSEEVKGPEDIEIQEPSGSGDLDAPDPSSKEVKSALLGRYEYQTSSQLSGVGANVGTFAEIKHKTPGQEQYEVMAGVPSTEKIYFSAGGEEFKMAVIMQHWVNEHSRDRTYTSKYSGTSCEYKSPDTAPPQMLGDQMADLHNGGTYTKQWTGTIPNNATAVTNLHNASCPAQPDYSEYNAALAEANAFAAEVNATTLSHMSSSDKENRENTGWSAGVAPSPSPPQSTSASVGCSYRAATKTSSGTPCGNEMATAEPGPDGSFTIVVTWRVPSHIICGPCCTHELPAIEDTWRQGLVYDYVKLAQIRLYKIDQASVNGMKELVGTDEIFATVKSGDPTFFFNAAQLTEQHYNSSPVVPTRPSSSGVGSEIREIDPKTSKNTYFGNSREVFSNGTTRRAEGQSSRSGRIRYSLEPRQHDDVVWNEGTRTNMCDGLGKTKPANVKSAGGLGHDASQPWAKGILYTNSPKGGTTYLHYSEKYNHHMNRADNEDKSRYDDRADSVDVARPEWQKFNERRRLQNVATVISDFLILQTSGGDQSIFYFDKESESREAQWHFPKVKATAAEMFTDNPNSIWYANEVCGNDGGLKVAEPYMNIGGYNGDYRNISRKYSPYNASTGRYMNVNQDRVRTVLDNDPAGTVIRPANKGNLKLMEDNIQILPTARNKPYHGKDATVFYKQVFAYYSYDDGSRALDGKPIIIDNVEISSQANKKMDEHIAIWGETVGLSYPTRYNAASKQIGVNPVIVYTPVSTEYATILPIDSVNMNGRSVSRDQRTSESIRTDLNDSIRALQVCPLDPGLCDHRVPNCKYTQDQKLAEFDFETGTKQDGASWVTTNKVTGMEHRLPVGFTIGNAGKVGTGSYLNAKNTRWSIPMSEIGLSSEKQNKVYVEMDMYMEDLGTNDAMLISFEEYGFQLKPRDSSLVGEFTTDLSGAGVKGTKKIRGNGYRNEVKVGLEFSLNNIMDNRAWVNGVEVQSNAVKTQLTEKVVNGKRTMVSTVVNVVGLDNAPEDLVQANIGNSINIGSWGKNNNYPANYYIDNLEIWLKGGTAEHNTTCYTNVATHELRKIHEHTTSCYTQNVTYPTCTGTNNYYGSPTCGYSTGQASCGIPQTGSGVYNMVRSDDDSGPSLEAYIRYYLTAGQSIKIQMGGYSGKDGAATLKTSGPGYSHNSGQRSYSGYFESSGSYVHEFVVPTSGYYTFETSNRTRDPYLGLYVRDGHRHVSGCYHYHSGSPGTSPSGCYSSPTSHRHTSACGRQEAGVQICNNEPINATTTMNVHEHTSACLDTSKLVEASGVDTTAKTYSRGATTYTVPATGTYELEVWGAQGGNGDARAGKGGYSKGTITLNQGEVLRINVGGSDGYNGGGTSNRSEGYGGGGTDIRRYGTSLGNRIIVAGGGGGFGGGASGVGGDGSGGNGITGGAGYGTPGQGGTQSSGGAGGRNANAGTLGQGGTSGGGSGNGRAGGGGGYYGGGGGGNDHPNYNDYDDSGGGGGSGYTGGLSSVTVLTGVGTGHGIARITPKNVTTVGSPIDGVPITNILGPNWRDYVTNGKYDIAKITQNIDNLPQGLNNPIFTCTREPNKHVCTEKCKMIRVLNCTEPHHSGGHYEGSNRTCWDACGIDENHANKVEIELEPGVMTKGAKFVQLDHEITVYFPNKGDFAGNNVLGIPAPQRATGRGYHNSMNTTRWTREKRVRFPYNVIHDGKMYRSGEWVELEVSKSYFDFYIPISNAEASNAGVEFEVEAINNGVVQNPSLDFSSRVYQPYGVALTEFKGSLANKWLSIISGGLKINQSSGGVQNYGDWFTWKQSRETTLLTNTLRGMNTDIWSEFNGRGSNSINERAKPLTTNDNYESVSNRGRTSGLESLHGGYKVVYVDVIGRIGNFTIQDTEDYRFSNTFKLPKTDPPEWLIDGFIYDVDQRVQNFYIGDEYDIRGIKAQPATRWLDTYGSQNWMTGQLGADGKRDINKSNKLTQVLTADINTIPQLKTEELRHGYDIYTSIHTMGDYGRANLSVTPYYYVMDKKTGNVEPLDVYISKEGVYKIVNKHGARASDVANLEKYNFNLDWKKEKDRRNYTLQEKFETDKAVEYLKQDKFDMSGVTDDGGQGGVHIGIEYPETPMGSSNYLGTAQNLLLDGRHRTFMGSPMTYGSIAEQNKWGINKNPGGRLEEITYTTQAHRWHYKLGVPSSAVFVKKGITPNKQTIEEVMNDDNVIILTTAVLAQGAMWTLEYKQPWLTHIEVDGKSYNIGNKNLPPIIAIYAGNNTAIEDVEVIKTH